MSISFSPQAATRHKVQEGTYQGHKPWEQCFYCSMPLRGVAVEWMGNGSTVKLHAGCVVDLMIRMMRDVHECQCKYEEPSCSRFSVIADEATWVRSRRSGQ